MKSQVFKLLWQLKFPEAYPIGYELKYIYKDRWFRIHSLPNSKRYAETEKEYQIIFERQNEIINDLVGEGEEIILVFGLYKMKGEHSNETEITEFGVFQKVDKLELHKIRPEENETACYFDIYAKKSIWQSNKLNHLLKAIAEDETRMMIIYPKRNRIINPYDGGVDLILESKELRNRYKEKYKQWLSKHPKGL